MTAHHTIGQRSNQSAARDLTARGTVSVIVPTIGRPASLARLLESLAQQTVKPLEVVVADASDVNDTHAVARDAAWTQAGLTVQHLRCSPPNAVRQRTAAIAASVGDLLLMLDDDVVLHPDCLEQMLLALAPDAVAVMATFAAQPWPEPTFLWRMYLKLWLRMRDRQWQGKVVGPLLRFGFRPVPGTPIEMEWLGAGMSLVRRRAYCAVGGFSDFFTIRSTINEDVDLGLKLARVGRILLCPTARLDHFHAPGGRVPTSLAAEDDLRNRFLSLHRTMGMARRSAGRLVLLYFVVETMSDLRVAIRHCRLGPMADRMAGRARAMRAILGSSL